MNFSRRDDEQIHIQGVIGELAFCRLFCLPIEIYDTTCRNSHNDTFDATMPNGWKVDIKTTLPPDAPILVSKWKRLRPPHIYALATLDNYQDKSNINVRRLPRVCFRGFVLASTILRDENLITMASGSVFFRWPQDRLRTLEELLEDPPHTA
jgi:hypothetical protein